MAVHLTVCAVKLAKVIASFLRMGNCFNGEIILTSSCVRYTQNKREPSCLSSEAHPLFTAQMETGSGADPCVIQPKSDENGDWGLQRREINAHHGVLLEGRRRRLWAKGSYPLL